MLDTVWSWSASLLCGLWPMYHHTQSMGLRILHCLCFSHIDMLQHMLRSYAMWMWNLPPWPLRASGVFALDKGLSQISMIQRDFEWEQRNGYQR